MINFLRKFFGKKKTKETKTVVVSPKPVTRKYKKLSKAQIKAIKAMRRSGMKVKDIASSTGIEMHVVSYHTHNVKKIDNYRD